MMEPTPEVAERLFDSLRLLAADYRDAYGIDDGLNVIGERLCRLADDEMLYSKGWAGFIDFLMKASG